MHSYNGILFSNEKEWITNIYNVTDEPENHYAGGKKRQDITFRVIVFQQAKLIYGEKHQNSSCLWV